MESTNIFSDPLNNNSGFINRYFSPEKRKQTISFLVLVILILAIPLAVWLAQTTQVFRPFATGAPIELVSNDPCVVSTNPNKVNCPTFQIKLTSPLGPNEGAGSSPLPSTSPAASPSSAGSPAPSPSSNPSPVPSASTAAPSPSPSPSAAASANPSPSPTQTKVQCIKSALNLQANPVLIENKNNTSIAYWDASVSQAQLTNAASQCGVEILKPTNFISSALEVLVRQTKPNVAKSVLVEGPCSAQKVNEYRNNQIKVSADVQCDGADINLDYKVFPTPNEFDGIGDFGANGQPAVVLPGLPPTISLSENTSKNINNGLMADLWSAWNSLLEVKAQENSIVTCARGKLDLGAPVLTANKNNTQVAYWDSVVGLDSLMAAASQCGAQLLSPTNFTESALVSLVRGVSKSNARSVLVEGPCSTQKVNDYRSNGITISGDVQCGSDPNLNYKVMPTDTDPVRGIGDYGSSGYAALVIPQAASSAAPSPTASSGSSSNPSSRTVKYRVAETEAGLASAEFKLYTSHPLITNFTFKDTNPGAKQIWVEFVSNTNQSRIEHIPVELIDKSPVIASLDCSMDIGKQNLQLTLNGTRLGNGSGKIVVDGKEAQILTWGDSEVTASIKPTGNLEDGKLFKVVLTRSDGKALPETSCRVNTALLSLGARLFCREPGKFDVSNVDVVIVDEGGSKVNEKVTIDKDGIINGLKTKLQANKKYAVSIKAPYSLRRNADFTASEGTTIISARDFAGFVLPVGDIAPVILPDGKINTLDRSEIVRQWSVLGSGTVSSKTGDFNRDTKVNSIDWACMRYDFNQEDNPLPTKAAPSTTPFASSTASVAPSLSPSSNPSSTPTPSSSTSNAFFLLAPDIPTKPRSLSISTAGYWLKIVPF